MMLAVLAVAAPLPAETPSTHKVHRAALESELRLARKPGVYFVFDLLNGRVRIKARGMVLQDLAITEESLWGTLEETQPLILEARSSIGKPERQRVPVGETASSTMPSALEVRDMPCRYRLHFSGGLTLRVNSQSSHFREQLASGVYALFWSLGRPIVSLAGLVRGNAFRWIDVTLPEEDAKTLYWTITDGAPAILYPPRP